ncbi:MAG: dipeptidase [Bacteroidetes bacterium]|jgi:acetylornithine deacetylase/succinyl-diaminopimelate desuccinylase-like protein|nr:dipeptidase [Bacteroidota bacterium]
MEKVQEYIEKNKDRFLSELIDFLRIPSISTNAENKEDVKKAAAFVKNKLLAAGADKAVVESTEGHPIVYGEKIINENAPTVLIYGHYDVQPPDPLELWDSPAFEPVIKENSTHPDGAIFARGACDDKGQVYMHIKAFESMAATGQLACNIKFMIEGEEEVGSPNLKPYMVQNKEKLKADVILVSDTAIIGNDTPSISVGLRGLSYVQVKVTGPNRDLHSGVYGGAVANPINVLARMISSLMDENHRITIPGFYDDVVDVEAAEREKIAQIPFNEKAYKADLEIDAVEGEKGYSTIERTSIRPTLDVNGIWGGYTKEGAKTVLPSEAYAKISMRLVPQQSSDKITELFTNHFTSIAPDSVKVEVEPHHGGEPVLLPTDSEEYLAAHNAMKTTFGKDPIPERGGGSIPIVPLFEDILGLKTILMGFGLDSDAIHSPNEHFGVFNFFKGIETIPHFFKNYSNSKK